MEVLLGGGFMLVLLFMFLSALFCTGVAISKGRSQILWFLLGFFFNILALIAVAGMPSLLHQPARGTHKRCPDCREFVYMDAKVCRCCGCKMSDATKEEKERGILDWAANA